jgi:hypothetical protein
VGHTQPLDLLLSPGRGAGFFFAARKLHPPGLPRQRGSLQKNVHALSAAQVAQKRKQRLAGLRNGLGTPGHGDAVAHHMQPGPGPALGHALLPFG